MLSFAARRSARVVGVLAATAVLLGLSAVAHAGSASAATTIGQTGDPTASDRFWNPGLELIAPLYVVPAGGGAIRSFQTQSSSCIIDPFFFQGSYDFQVLRPLGGDQYKVLGDTGNQTDPCNSQLVSYAVSPIQVQSGDVLGAYIVSPWVGLLFADGGQQFSFQSEPAVGDTISAAPDPTTVIALDESATLTSTSSLAAGQLVRDAQHLAPGTALADKATAIQTAVNASPPQTATACAGITNFLGLVKSQTGKKLNATNAGQLTTDANNLAAALGC